MTIGILIFGAAVLPAQPEGAAATDLRRALSPEAFERAGLTKLSAEELAYLEARVRVRAQAGAAPDQVPMPVAELPQGEEAFGKDEEMQRAVTTLQRVPEEIRSRIRGEFKGWRGKTRFTLENGQVWEQTGSGVFALIADSPAVTIRRGAFGTYFLKVDGYNSRTKVARVQ
jgi:hypothetical protein